ncbi:hypothetical protein [Lactococcus lactis]|uniref:hypothetical protein n=1 Tax=Lactococcus lactis TaxID=1358 RepID=UPI00223BAA81|nr:hypothetical protein [Lactococcus lactis]MCT0449383.1 hypothetical protein [Lactococcus lactis subsp. lactis]
MTQETAKERIYREALEILRGMGINSKNRVMMPYGVAVTAQEFIEEKLEDAENMPSTTDKLSVEKLQEQLNTLKKALTEIKNTIPDDNSPLWHNPHFVPNYSDEHIEIVQIAEQALAAIGGDDE